MSQIKENMRAGYFIESDIKSISEKRVMIKNVVKVATQPEGYQNGWLFEDHFLKPEYFGEAVEKEFTVLCHDYDDSTQTHLTAFATDQLDSDGSTMVISGLHLMGFSDSQIKSLFQDVQHGDKIRAKVRQLKLYDGGVPDGFSLWAIEKYYGVTFSNPLGADHSQGACTEQYQSTIG